MDVNMFLRGYSPTPIEPRANALMRGIEMQRARQGNALQQLQMDNIRQQQAEAAAQREQAMGVQAAYRNALEMPLQQAAAQGMTRPTPGNAAALGQMQPRLNQQRLAQELAQVDPMAAAKMLTPAATKIKDYRAIRNADGSVSYVGLTDDGRVVQTGQQPFEKPEVRDFGGSVGGIDPITGKVQTYGPKTMTPGERDSSARGWAGLKQSQAQFETRQAADAAKADAPPKPLPPGALKMQQDALDKIGIAASINADLGAVAEQIKGGKLSFGPVSNLANQGLNMAGMSTEGSRNFASFKSTMERLRNESLRLNTGVQTDGDAQRAWNELFQNINDTDLVQQRLVEIQGINARGAELQRLRADSVRANYGLPPVDVEQYAAQPPALNQPAGAKPPAIGGKSRLTPAEQAELEQLRKQLGRK